MTNRRFRKRLAMILSAAMLTLSMPGYILAEDQQTEIIFDNRNEDVDGTPETEVPEQKPTEPETQAPTEPETQAPTEPETQKPTESETQPPTESETQAPIESETQAPTELETQAPTESETQKPSEPMTESEAETESEIEKETEKETEKEKTERETEKETEKEEKVPGFSVDPSAYPAVNITENTLEIYRYLVEEMGLNHAAACGILANIQMESNFNQLAIGDGGTSFGICQWHLSRLSNLMGVCTSLGLDYRTVEGQLVYLEYELNSGYTNVLNYIRSVPNTAQGAYDAAYYWCMHFEMPSQTEARSVQRGNLAMHEYFLQSFNLEKIEKEAYFYETADNVNVRKEPGMEAEVLEVLPKGTTLDVRKKAGEWYCISYKEGEAYVKCEFVKMISSSKENVEKEEMIKQALEENAVFVKKNTQEMQMDLMNQGMELSILKQISRAEAENEKN